jgi:serine/threonine protein phosphatase PrpC/tRNA A-37 threonylcarbamoyl transferase component Bud32
MKNNDIKTSGFSLSKGKTLKGDDFYDVKSIENLTIAIVCDGVGSAQEGALAAKRVTHHLMTNFKNRPLTWSIEKSIKFFIESINAILYEESIVNYGSAELVTTLTIIVIEGNRLYGANVGDSRVYLHRNNRLNQLSIDHTMDEDGYENVLTQAIGITQDVSAYYFENIIQKYDKILLCSDGLYNVLNEVDLANYIDMGANALVKKASKFKKDNLPDDTTAVIVEILEENQIEILKAQDLHIPETLNVNDVIDGYIFKKSLIQNNRTWLCTKKSKTYVLKFPSIESIDDKNMLDLFVKEAWNAKRLKAGFFPKAVIPKNRTARYYIQENINGTNLKTYLEKRKLHIDDAIQLAKTLLNMSQYLLKFDLVHGDIKPENIMVIKRGGKYIFKIIDFGSMTEIYSINSKAGTPSYLAPQRFEGANISEKTELFAIGVTLYESLTQKFPYGEIEPFQTPTFKTAKSPKILNNNIPLWLESIILRAIAVDENSRYSNYSMMIYELENSKKVKPFFNKNISWIERNPLLVARIGFFIMLGINIILLLN